MLKKLIKNNKIESILEYFVSSAFFLFLFITLIIIVSSIIFICGGRIFKLLLLIIYILTTCGYLFIKSKNLKKGIISVIIATLVFAISTFISGYIYDGTPDGNTYHKLAVGAMKNGWNPVYVDIKDFNRDKGNPFDILKDNINVKWVNTYAKGSEIYGAVIYSFTDNIESGKSFNILFVFIGLFIAYKILRQLKLNTWKSILLSILMALNPISLTQLTNYYLDGVLSICLFMIILIIMNREKLKEKVYYLILALLIIWCCSVKFTGLAFAGVFCGMFYLYNIVYLFIKDKKEIKNYLIKETIFYVVVVVISVLIVGSSSYTKNFIEHGHPFYPLYGKGHVENMVLMEMPNSMQNDNKLMIFIKGIFSKSENSSPSYSTSNDQPDWKIPFTLTRTELYNFITPDIRIGGFGYFFGGIFILSVIGTIIYIIKFIKQKQYEDLAKNILFLLIASILILALDGSYWARYIPYVYMFPILTIYNLFRVKIDNRVFKIYPLIICIFMILNSALIIYVQIDFVHKHNLSFLRQNINDFNYYAKHNKEVEICLDHHGIQGVQYNLDDMKIDNYKIVEDKKDNIGYGFTY